ncbi:MAG: hypothetical protein ACI8X5_001864 [Planctomycetota bacterium]|jgi:hypothetical protein
MMGFQTSHLRGAALSFLTLGVAGGAIFGCRALDYRADLASAVKSAIHEPERRSEIQGVLDARDRNQDEFLAEVVQIQLEFRDTIANVSPNPDRAAELFKGFDANYVIFRDQTIASSMQLRKMMTEEEWAAVSGADADAILSGAVRPPKQ